MSRFEDTLQARAQGVLDGVKLARLDLVTITVAERDALAAVARILRDAPGEVTSKGRWLEWHEIRRDALARLDGTEKSPEQDA